MNYNFVNNLLITTVGQLSFFSHCSIDGKEEKKIKKSWISESVIAVGTARIALHIYAYHIHVYTVISDRSYECP